MKQTLTFHPSLIASTQSKINVDAWDISLEAFEQKEYLRSFYALLDYVNPELRSKYGNPQGTEFSVPHGSIIVNLKLEDNTLKIWAPFLSLPQNGRVPLLRQIAALNFNNMDLGRITLNDKNELYFEYSCPMELVNPYKIYYILEEICTTGDKYDDEYVTEFDAVRIYEPKVKPYPAEVLDSVYNVIQISCAECLEAVKYFEGQRKYGFAWNVIECTILKILYYAHPQGQLLNDFEKAHQEHDREDIPLPEVVANGRKFVETIQAMPKEKMAQDLYYVETFIPPKRRSTLQNIQENFQSSYEKATSYYGENDHMSCCVTIVYKFYQMYHNNNVSDDINNLVTAALIQSSGKPWDEASKILYKAMKKIMDGDLSGVDMNVINNAMKSVLDTEVGKKVKSIFSSIFGKK